MEYPRFRVFYDESGELRFCRGAGPVVPVRPVRCLPLSDPERWISLVDRNGQPVQTIPCLSDLDRESRACLEQELERRSFVPRVLRILSAREEFGVLFLEVATDRGNRRLQVANRENIRFVSPARVLIQDQDGNRYDIPSIPELDRRSRGLLEEHF